MLTRLTHAAIAFAVTAALYQAYYLAVVPFVEPPQTARDITAVFEETSDGDARALDKHRDLLSAYFPPGHWCFDRPPITIGDGQLLIIADQSYQHTNDAKLVAPKCALVFFPRRFDGNGPPPRNAVVLEPSHGAELQLENMIGKGSKGLGSIENGTLKGEIDVRSDMNEPGPHDDLLLKTRDLYINKDLLRTDQPVDIKLGGHHGFGRELEIRRLNSDNPSGAGAGFYGSFEELVIKRDVTVSFSPGRANLFGQSDDPASKGRPAPPVRIKSAGPFRVDFGSYKATFDDQVRAWQLHPTGKMDELLATKLTLFFTKTNQWNADGDVTPTAGSVAQGFSFEPASVEAIGTPETPVVMKAPSQDAMAQGGRLWIELANRRLSRITLEEGEEVMLRHQGMEIHARTLRYQLPPEGSGQRIGAMSARGGSGWMRAVPDAARPHEVVEVSWKDAMQLVRRNGQPVLVLDGRPKVSLVSMGTMWADQLQLFLREQPDGAAKATDVGPASLSAALQPEQITATGRVGIESNELVGKVNQLNIRIQQESAVAGTAGAGAGTVGGSPPNSPFSRNGGGAKRAYNINGVTLELDVVMRDRRPDVRGIRVDGGVVFEEMAVAGAEPPLRIVAEHLKVTGADTPNAQIEIIGGGGQDGAPLKDAEITAGGAEIRAPALSINRGSSKALINSPGKLKLMVDRDLTGNPLPGPSPMWIDWQQSMQLEGRRITFLGDVYVRNDASGWLRTRRLVAQMTSDIRFDGTSGQRPQLEQIECWEGALANFEQHDISGLVARHHIEMQSLRANQVNGLIDGAGPGFIDSVHFSKNSAALLALPNSGGQPAAPELVQNEPELRHLHIDFVRGVDGNLLQKRIAVHGDVECVYGPVASWDKKLTMSPGGDPEPGVVWITSESLGVTESPLANVISGQKARQFELEAIGRVSIEGQDPRQGAFTAYGHRATYDQAKGLFILEGDGRTPATIEQQQYPGAPSSPQSAQRMQFNQNTGSIRIDGLQKGQFHQLDIGRQPGAAQR